MPTYKSIAGNIAVLDSAPETDHIHPLPFALAIPEREPEKLPHVERDYGYVVQPWPADLVFADGMLKERGCVYTFASAGDLLDFAAKNSGINRVVSLTLEIPKPPENS